MATTGQRTLVSAPARRGDPGLAAMLAAWFSVLVVLFMWVRGGGARDLADGGDGAYASAGRLTGLISADFLLIQVVLMARVPWIERAFGQDTLARTHRLVGFASVQLLVAHIVLITIGYRAIDGRGLLAEAWHLVVAYPGMLLAAAGALALGLVAVTSMRRARRRLRYESWHLLHLYAYLGIGLALPHELWTGADLVASPLARFWWWTTYAVAAGCLVMCRLALPVYRSLRHGLRVVHVAAEAPGILSVYLTGRAIDRLPVRAGQFFTWRFAGPGWTRGHPYSISAAPRPDTLRISVKALGDDSATLHRLRPGTRAFFEGPHGRLTGAVRTRRRLTLIAAGIGVTPMRALLEAEPYGPGEAVLLYRVRRPRDIAFAAEFDVIAGARGARVHYLPGDRGPHGSWLPGREGDPAAALARMVPEIRDSDVFVCGPEPWMAAVHDTLTRLDVPATQVHLERFGW